MTTASSQLSSLTPVSHCPRSHNFDIKTEYIEWCKVNGVYPTITDFTNVTVIKNDDFYTYLGDGKYLCKLCLCLNKCFTCGDNIKDTGSIIRKITIKEFSGVEHIQKYEICEACCVKDATKELNAKLDDKTDQIRKLNNRLQKIKSQMNQIRKKLEAKDTLCKARGQTIIDLNNRIGQLKSTEPTSIIDKKDIMYHLLLDMHSKLSYVETSLHLREHKEEIDTHDVQDISSLF